VERIRRGVEEANRCVVEEVERLIQERRQGGRKKAGGGVSDVGMERRNEKSKRSGKNVKMDVGAVRLRSHLSHSLDSREKERRPVRQSLQRS